MKHLLYTTFFLSSFSAAAQYTVVLQPHFARGQDVDVEMMDSTSFYWPGTRVPHIIDSNLYGSIEHVICTWTFSDCPGKTRQLIRFADLKNPAIIPSSAIILSAKLYLFSIPDSSLSSNWGNNYFPGTPLPYYNQCWIYELADTFNAHKVTWRTQPGVKHTDSIEIGISHKHWGDSTVIKDVTAMTRDMFTGTNTGFMIRLEDEDVYRDRSFTSSHYPDSSLHPMLVVTLTLNGDTVIISRSISCNTVKFQAFAGDSVIPAWHWYFGDHTDDTGNIVTHTYGTPGVYYVQLVTTTFSGKIDTTIDTIIIHGDARYNIRDSLYNCGTVKARAIHIGGDTAASSRWDWGDGITSSGDSVFHTYKTYGKYPIKFFVYTNSGCTDTFTKEIEIGPPQYLISDSVFYCAGMRFHALWVSGDTATSFAWSFGDGIDATTTDDTIIHIYPSGGMYHVRLILSDSANCTDSTTKDITIRTFLPIKAWGDTIACVGEKAHLHASGGVSYIWFPKKDFDNDTLADPVARPTGSTAYVVEGLDTNECASADTVYINVVPLPEISININDKYHNCTYHGVQLIATGAQHYSWSPATLCNYPLSDSPVVLVNANSQLFTVKGIDSNGCAGYDTITVYKYQSPTVALPTAFSPNGDGSNDVLYVRGDHFHSFHLAIYNRWGNEVFSTSDINTGWNGTYRGNAQPVETYSYILKIRDTDGCDEAKTGSIILLR